jgi:hypothetical protein
MKIRMSLVLGSVLLVLLSSAPVVSASPPKHRVLDRKGHEIGYIQGRNVFTRAGKLMGWRGAPLGGSCQVIDAQHQWVAVVRTTQAPIFRLYKTSAHGFSINPANLIGMAEARGSAWGLYVRVKGRLRLRGTVRGGRGVNAGTALRLLFFPAVLR